MIILNHTLLQMSRRPVQPNIKRTLTRLRKEFDADVNRMKCHMEKEKLRRVHDFF